MKNRTHPKYLMTGTIILVALLTLLLLISSHKNSIIDVTAPSTDNQANQLFQEHATLQEKHRQLLAAFRYNYEKLKAQEAEVQPPYLRVTEKSKRAFFHPATRMVITLPSECSGYEADADSLQLEDIAGYYLWGCFPDHLFQIDYIGLSTKESVRHYVNEHYGEPSCYEVGACSEIDWERWRNLFEIEENLIAQQSGDEEYDFLTIESTPFLVKTGKIAPGGPFQREYITHKGDTRIRIQMAWPWPDDNLEASNDLADSFVGQIRIYEAIR